MYVRFGERCYKKYLLYYDTKHSNLFLAHYVNQVLNAVGNDVIVRGLVVEPKLDLAKTGIEFTISSGALIQDLTYFELPLDNRIHVENVNFFPDFYIVIYTNWRYIQTVYDNNLKIECTFYNPKTRTALGGWNTATNRIILGIYKFEVDSNGFLTNIESVTDNIYFADSNIVQNGNFDEQTTKYWTAINSTIITHPTDGCPEDTPYLEITPIGNNYQGVAQSILTKVNFDYEINFCVRSDALVPFSLLVLDGNNLYDINALQIASLNLIAPQQWGHFSLKFTALSNNTTLFFLKTNNSYTDKFDLDNIFCIEYTENRKPTDLNKIKMIDGGKI